MVIKTVRMRVERQQLSDLVKESEDASEYVSKKEFDDFVKSMKVMNTGGANDIDESAIIEYTLSGEGTIQEKIAGAIEMLQKKQSPSIYIIRMN